MQGEAQADTDGGIYISAGYGSSSTKSSVVPILPSNAGTSTLLVTILLSSGSAGVGSFKWVVDSG